uniref:Cadherin N-terminal domain-containing protein n=1 Tax=Paramormyrops kingsleyae TaxID=1676925 RepID=A0A3B3RIT9_9TELE
MGHKGFTVNASIHLWILFILTFHSSRGDMSYSIPEEMRRGSVIGNIAKDLGLDVKRLSDRKARLDADRTSRGFCDINLSTGDLIVAERIDREELCGSRSIFLYSVFLIAYLFGSGVLGAGREQKCGLSGGFLIKFE